MNESKLLSKKGMIYALLVIGVITLTSLNFWGWFFVKDIRQKILLQLKQQLKNASETYALLIGKEYLLEDIFALPQNDLQFISLQLLLSQFKDKGDLENIFIVSLNRDSFINYDYAPEAQQRVEDFPINDSLFYRAALGESTEPELFTFAGEYFLTAYSPIYDLTDEVSAVLVLEAPAQLFSTLQFFRQALLYIGLGGLAIIIIFAGIIILSVRQLFRAETQLHQQTRLAQLGEMAAMVAHEIRNPLSIIKGSADVLRKKYASTKDELFDYIPDEINRLNRLVNDFLQFARRRKLALKPIKVQHLLTTLVDQMNDPRIHVELSETNPEMSLDRDAFRQIMLNILDNACQATQNDGKILVRTYPVKDKSQQFVIEVVDNGMGMPSETQQKIFDPFFSTRASGSGLGMTITKQLVEQMNGKISVKSREYKGTSVQLTFPY